MYKRNRIKDYEDMITSIADADFSENERYSVLSRGRKSGIELAAIVYEDYGNGSFDCDGYNEVELSEIFAILNSSVNINNYIKFVK